MEANNQPDGFYTFPSPELDGYLAEDEDPVQRELALASARISMHLKTALEGAAIGITVTDLD